MRRYRSQINYFLAVLLLAQTVYAPRLQADEFFGRIGRFFKEAEYHGVEPVTYQAPSIEYLAANIDWLEHHIDRYGSIVAKQPDVWGESRWTRHRFEYERIMKEELDDFTVKLNGALRRSDQAFLGMAFALQAAAGTRVQNGTRQPTPIPAADTSNSEVSIISNLISDPTKAEPGNTSVIQRTNPGQILPVEGVKGFSFETDKLSLEPTIELNQLSRYLNHLQELRRINEGDDIGDSPGYALNLVRIPISILPGKLTQTGFGAEVTIIAEPYLGPELLPTTFRTLVINDMVDYLAPILTAVANDPESAQKIDKLIDTEKEQAETSGLKLFKTNSGALSPLGITLDKAAINEIQTPTPSSNAKEVLDAANALSLAIEKSSGQQNAINSPILNSRRSRTAIPLSQVKDVFGNLQLILLLKEIRKSLANEPQSKPFIDLMDVRAYLRAELDASYDLLINPENCHLWNKHCTQQLVTVIHGRRIPSIEILRANFLCDLGKDEQGPLLNCPHWGKPVCPVAWNFDAEMFEPLNQYETQSILEPASVEPVPAEGLQEENKSPKLPTLRAPMESVEKGQVSQHCPLENSSPVDCTCPSCTNKYGYLVESRECAVLNEKPVAICQTVTGVLAWAVIVESALLNERLQDDMRETAGLKNSHLLMADIPMQFYGPNPPPEAREAFNEYVRVRWPIHVFALDPVSDEQNIADAYARRRELQVAMSIAFASGRMNAQALMRHARRLEWDMATIALNQTSVGFSHGSDTFGWRFFPRFQTPPIKTGFAAFGQTLFGGPSRECDLNSRQIESGMRECTAIVVMPSFVPYATFDVRTNWFKLANPKNAALTMKDTMRFSRAITAMRNSQAECSRCAHLYREGEVQRLLRRVDQLDRELPLQTMQIQIPYENTAGGFEVFNNGITELAPELIGWYGAPGINPEGPTNMFLVGDGFSVHDTHVTAGGKKVDFELISRQLMRVTIPSGLQIVRDKHLGDDNQPSDHFAVDVHLATSYGVSSHMLIPVGEKQGNPVTRFEWNSRPKIYVTYELDQNGKLVADKTAVQFEGPRNLILQTPTLATNSGALDIKLAVTENNFPSTSGSLVLGKLELTGRLDVRSKEYIVDGASFDALATQLLTIAKSRLAIKTADESGINWVAAGTVQSTNGTPDSIVGDLIFEVSFKKR